MNPNIALNTMIRLVNTDPCENITDDDAIKRFL